MRAAASYILDRGALGALNADGASKLANVTFASAAANVTFVVAERAVIIQACKRDLRGSTVVHSRYKRDLCDEGDYDADGNDPRISAQRASITSWLRILT